MIILDSTLSIQVYLGGAVTTNELSVYASYLDINGTNFGSTAEDFEDNVTAGAADVTAVTAPSSGTIRQVRYITVTNLDTVDAVVTIQVTGGAVDTELITITLAAGETLEYKDGRFINVTTGGGAGASELSNLNDVTITAIASGEILKWNGSEWINNTIAEAGIAATGDLHDAVTVSDSAEIDFTLTGQDITAVLITGSVDVLKLDAGVQTSLGLADTSVQPGDALSSLDTSVTGTQLDGIKTKVDYITITQAVDLDTLESRVNALDQAVVFMGTWDASAGTFPTSTNAGEMWTVSVLGTVDGIDFEVEDRILALVDGASTTVYAANWHKNDSSDKVNSVAGRTGTVVLVEADITDLQNYAVIGGAHHDGFSDYVANEHIDWTSASAAFSTTGTLAAGVTTLTGNNEPLILDTVDALAQNMVLIKVNGVNKWSIGAKGTSADFGIYSYGAAAYALSIDDTTSAITLASTLAVTGATQFSAEALAWFDLGTYSATTYNNVGYRIRSSAAAATANWAGIHFQATAGDSTDTGWQIGISTHSGSYLSELIFKRKTGASSYTEAAKFDVSGNLDLAYDLSVTGALTAASYGGITEANLLDKTATETISGAWTYTDLLTIQDGLHTLRLGADNGTTTLTDATQKLTRVSLPHYTNAEEPAAILVASSTSSSNSLSWGGATSLLNAATHHYFYTAANNTTVTGTAQLSISHGLAVFAGVVELPNAISLRWKNSSGTGKTVLQLYSDNSVYLDSQVSTYFRVNGATSLANAMLIASSKAITMYGDLTVNGAFTSLGIDDNATSERLQVGNSLLVLSTASTDYGVVSVTNDASITYGGGSSTTNGTNIVMYGGIHATLANDFILRKNAENKIYRDDSASTISFADKMMVGSTSVTPDSTFHVHTATAGAVTADGSADDLVIENSANGGLSMLTPDANYGSIVWGSPTSATGAVIDFSYNAGILALQTYKVGASIALKADNGVTNLTLSGAAASELATFAGKAAIDITQFSSTYSINVSGAGIAFKNDLAGSSDNWSNIRNTSTASGSNLVFGVGLGDALTLNHDLSAALASDLDLTGNLGIGVAAGTTDNIHVLANNTYPNASILVQSDDTASATATILLYARDASNINKSVSIQNSLGALVIAGSIGTTITTGDLTISAGGVHVKAGNIFRAYRTDNTTYTDIYDSGAGVGAVFNNANSEGFHFRFNGTDVFDINSSSKATFSGLLAANQLTTIADSLWFLNDTNATATGYINYYGYDGGISQFRNLIISNGKGATIVTMTGSTKAVTFVGAVAKGSGSFKIDHVLPEMKDTHHLVHSFIEGPQADLIYRGKVDLVDGKAVINIDEAGRMTEGTFTNLCGNVQCFTTNESGYDLVKSRVEGNLLIIEAKNSSSTDEISWLVVGERIDEHMLETEWTDKNGRVITEPLKEAA
jgi:hypothetical protein